jgi:tripartite-type tricarboxylate transporter receptor subunit TctC
MFIRRPRILPALACALLCELATLPAHAQQKPDTYPTRPVRLIVPYSPGGASDNIGRLVMPRVSEALGQSIVIDNRPGAAGNLGRDLVAKAAPDGYTLLATDAPHTINVHLQRNIPFDALRDFAPITTTGTAPMNMVVNSNFPAKSVKDIVAMARAQPGKLNFGSGGPGAITHVSGELFKLAAGVNIVHVPYKSIAPAIIDVLGGQIEIAFTSGATVSGHIHGGRLRLLAVASAKRSPAYPDAPTFEEAGVPGMIAANWYGIMGPAKLPQSIVQRLNTEIHKAVRSRDVQERFTVAGIETILNTPREFQTMLETETARWAKVVKAAGLKPE